MEVRVLTDVYMHLLESLLMGKRGHSTLQHPVVARFATTSWPDDHESVTHLDGVIELEDLLNKKVHLLYIIVLAGLLYDLVKIAIIEICPFNTREQVEDDVFEQRNIILQEFGHVDVSQGS